MIRPSWWRPVKLKNGLSRIIPKISTSREGVSNKIDLNLASVSINGQEVPHKIIEESDSYVIVPEEEYTLEPGVYTYNFQYLVDRQLWQYNDFNEFYWDATGSRWNLIIGKAMVSIRLPGSSKPLSSLVFLGYPDELTSAGTMMSEHKNVLGFAALVPLYIGEGMHVIVALPKTDFVPADRNRRLTWFLEDYGDILVATVGLLSILISYYLSWKHIAKNNLKNSNSFKRGAPLMRYLAMGVFDKISFAAFLLELYRKNIIDIQRGDKDILLVKRTDNLSSLERKERKAVNALFSRSEAVLALNAANQLKLKRAYKQVEANTLRKVKQLALKLNIGYLLFSIGIAGCRSGHGLAQHQQRTGFCRADRLHGYHRVLSVGIENQIQIPLARVPRKSFCRYYHSLFSSGNERVSASGFRGNDFGGGLCYFRLYFGFRQTQRPYQKQCQRCPAVQGISYPQCGDNQARPRFS